MRGWTFCSNLNTSVVKKSFFSHKTKNLWYKFDQSRLHLYHTWINLFCGGRSVILCQINHLLTLRSISVWPWDKWLHSVYLNGCHSGPEARCSGFTLFGTLPDYTHPYLHHLFRYFTIELFNCKLCKKKNNNNEKLLKIDVIFLTSISKCVNLDSMAVCNAHTSIYDTSGVVNGC